MFQLLHTLFTCLFPHIILIFMEGANAILYTYSMDKQIKMTVNLLCQFSI